MEKKIAPPLPPKEWNEKSKSSPSSKKLIKGLEENIQLQPALKKRYGFIFAKTQFSSEPQLDYEH